MAIILIRTLIIFLALIVAMRLMGKRQLGELELSELVVAVLIADIASIPLQNPSLPLSYGFIPLLVLLAQCSYALYIVLFKNFVGRYSPVTIMKWMFTYSFVCLLPFSYDDLIATEWTALERNALLSLGYIVVGSTFLSYILVIVGQKLLRPTVAGMYNYVQPLVASIVAVCWGMDSFNLSKILSVVLIFGGVYLVTMSRSRADEERTAAAGGGAKEA